MSESLHSRASEAFERACELEGAERAEFLAELQREHGELHALVARLLAHDSESIDFLGEAQVVSARSRLSALLEDDAPLPADDDGEVRVGPYRVLRRVGEGGMGVVYEAEQQSPRRRVALKISRPVRESGSRLQRFRQEAEVLGRLQHAGIARVLSAGTLELGGAERPYFAMEFVEGEPVTDFADRHALDLHARLELVARICEAVEHAHAQGVVHRDLKPDNVLVRPDGAPVVLDFGVARLSSASTVLTTLNTAEGELLGTLAYMAPEQVAADPDAVTPAADVYALGVLLFELLSGRTPHDLDGLSLGAVVRLLSEHAPPPLRSYRPDLVGDVDTIVGKALELEPSRRYATGAALGADLRAFLDQRPIAARPPTRAYRARRFVARNRALTASVAGIFVALLLGLAGTLAFARDALEARAEADASALDARRSNARVVSRLMQAARSSHENDQPWRALDALDEVPSELRGWGWHLFVDQLPRRLDVPYEMTADPLAAPAPRRPIWRWLDEDRLFGLDQQSDSVWIASTDGRPHVRVCAGLTLDEVGRATASGLCMATAGTRALLLDLEQDRVLGAWDTSGGVPPGHVSEDGEVLAFYTSPTTVDVHAHGEVRATLTARTAPDRTVRPEVLVTPGGRTVLVNRLEELEVLEVENATSETVRAAPPHDRLAARLLDDGWMTIEWSAAVRDSAAWRRWSAQGESTLRAESRTPVQHMSAFAVSRDGSLIALNSGSRVVLCDATSGEPVRRSARQDANGHLDQEGHFWTDLRFAPNGRKLLVLANDVAPLVVDIASHPAAVDRPVHALEVAVPRDAVWHVAISNDGSLFATMGIVDELVRVFDARTGEQLASTSRHAAPPTVHDALLLFTADDRRLVLTSAMDASNAAAVVDWDLDSGRTEVFKPSEPIVTGNHAALLDELLDRAGPIVRPRLSRRVGWDGERALALWLAWEDLGWKDVVPDERGARWRTAPQPGADPREETQALALDPTSNRYAIASVVRSEVGAFRPGGVITIRDGADGEQLERIEVEIGVWGLAWSPDGSRLAMGCIGGEVMLLETEFFTVQHTFRAHAITTTAVAWFPDGERLLTASESGVVRVWDARPTDVRDAELEAWRRATGVEAEDEPGRDGRDPPLESALERAANRVSELRIAR